MRRLGSTPEERGSATGQSCPDIFAADDETEFFVIGRKPTEVEAAMLDAFVNDGEAAVVIPRRVLLDAKKDIPDE